MLGFPFEVRDPSRAGGARGREVPAFLKGTMLDPDYVPPQRSTDDTYSDTYGDTGQQNTGQQFLHDRSTNTVRSTDSGRSTDGARSAGVEASAGPGACGEPVGSGVLVSELRQRASLLAVSDLPEGAGLCVGETEELLFTRDRLDSAIAARVGRVHATGEARSAASGGHASTGTWLRASAGMTGGAASALVRLAVQLARLPVVRDRFACGALAEGSVEAICQVTDRLSDEQAALVEPILLELADGASPAEIGKAGRYLRELLDPGTLEDDAEDDYATRFLLVRPSSTGGVEGEFRLPREAGARLREFLTAYARPKGKDDDRPLRVRQADALSALLSKKVTTELLVLVRAESLPTDHPTHDHPTTGHPASDADCTPAASTAASDTADAATTAASGTPATGGPPSQSTSGRAATTHPDNADTADTAGSSDARPGTPQAGDGSTRRASGPHHTGSTSSTGDGTGSADTRSAGAGTDSADTGSTGPGTGSMDTGSTGAGTANTDTGAGSASTGAGSASTGAGSASTGAGSASTGAGSASTGEGPVPEACRICGHAPDRLAPGLLIATGQLLPISDVHRLARTSRLVRMVVDAKGRVLDMGRAVRLATPAQRQAILARYTTCYRDDCAIPADMCEIDHVTGWAEGGTTDLDQLAPACAWHNRDKATHPDRYRTRRNHDGTWTLLHLGKRGRFAARFRR
ncbi:hypothetical protein Aple_027630 [Acrocarpospora pleiomorpha]|uniref:HNH nuclease domain-containing protein n=1 Tax=Acrocarpospora pleiomorpha TaxID=90975 RepID=A0A5M3XE25_9ACTN|nr:DUF222 domain-containing protein [Acrocarpospora pleiomorpha]GES19867.1 hypothetical protein Aple_027630 [Acrocarpospora pleiomorpha]